MSQDNNSSDLLNSAASAGGTAAGTAAGTAVGGPLGGAVGGGLGDAAASQLSSSTTSGQESKEPAELASKCNDELQRLEAQFQKEMKELLHPSNDPMKNWMDLGKLAATCLKFKIQKAMLQTAAAIFNNPNASEMDKEKGMKLFQSCSDSKNSSDFTNMLEALKTSGAAGLGEILQAGQEGLQAVGSKLVSGVASAIMPKPPL